MADGEKTQPHTFTAAADVHKITSVTFQAHSPWHQAHITT